MGRARRGAPVSGWVALDKPLGMGSTEAVARVRRLFGAQKAGHAGTLDPLATGALPVALGEATKTVPFLMAARKRYRFTVRFGASTTTGDLEGDVLRRSDAIPGADALAAALPAFVGEILQAPHAYSAVKVGGERAYDLARRGEVPDLRPRPVTVEALSLVGPGPYPTDAVLEVACGKGVYVRSLCVDIAARLGAEAHVVELRRLMVGPFGADRLISLETLEDLVQEHQLPKALLPVETPLDDIPAVAVTPEDAFRLRQGRSIVLLPRQAEALTTRLQTRGPRGEGASRTVSAMAGGAIVALCELAAGRLSPTRVFQTLET